MRVKWKERNGILFTYVGPCQLMLRPGTWLADAVLGVLQRSYADWRAYGARLGRREPVWSTAPIALELSQYGSRPDDLRVADKRFYQLVYATLGRLARRKLITSSTGLDDRGRETRLWAPAA